MASKPRRRAKNKVSDIPPEELKRVALLNPSAEELSFVFDIPLKHAEDLLKNEDIQEELLKGKGGRRLSLKRAQWKSAMGGNVAMLIWLGKQDLGQSDKGTEGEDAIEMATKITIALKEMHRRTAKTSSAPMKAEDIEEEAEVAAAG
tara:strand:+ start:4950 stop:5390 length:441 start_codon:yes stop_codon:yes gene_type:complete